MLFFLVVSAIATLLILLSTVNGYTSKGAIVVSRGLTVKATMDGVVADASPAVGSRVALGSSLVAVQNNRIDRSRLYELQSQREMNQLALESSQGGVQAALAQLEEYRQKSQAYLEWYREDIQFRHQQAKLLRNTAHQQLRLSAAAVKRGQELSESGHLIATELDRYKRNAAIDANKLWLLDSEIAQLERRIEVLKDSDTVFRDDGDADYWTRMGDELNLEIAHRQQEIVALELKAKKLERQIAIENGRLIDEATEIHQSPFEGVVNAVFSSKGDLVTAETPLLQILDCLNPIAIVSVREHAVGQFSVGQLATISPVDTDRVYSGYVQYISNGPLISRDTSLAIPADVSQDGSKIIVAFDRNSVFDIDESCSASRRAVVSIHTGGTLSRVAGMVRNLFDRQAVTNEVARNEKHSDIQG
jgi:multidrug resistance efflux pump